MFKLIFINLFFYNILFVQSLTLSKSCQNHLQLLPKCVARVAAGSALTFFLHNLGKGRRLGGPGGVGRGSRPGGRGVGDNRRWGRSGLHRQHQVAVATENQILLNQAAMKHYQRQGAYSPKVTCKLKNLTYDGTYFYTTFRCRS